MSPAAATPKKAPAKRAASRKTARPKADIVPDPAAVERALEADDEGSAAAGMLAEVATLDIPDGALAVRLAGTIVHVQHTGKWFSSTHTALRTGDFDSWAEDALIPGEFEGVWCQINEGRGPRTEEIEEMFAEWKTLTGNDGPKLPRSTNSFRRMARR